MKKKGFTLIELLAVIVILAIIALIAVPIVLNMIEKSKESATLRSAEHYLNAVEQGIARAKLNNIKVDDGSYNVFSNGNICKEDNEEVCLTIEVQGEKPTGGKIIIENEKIKETELIYGDKTIIFDEGILDIKKPISEQDANEIIAYIESKIKEEQEKDQEVNPYQCDIFDSEVTCSYESEDEVCYEGYCYNGVCYEGGCYTDNITKRLTFKLDTKKEVNGVLDIENGKIVATYDYSPGYLFIDDVAFMKHKSSKVFMSKVLIGKDNKLKEAEEIIAYIESKIKEEQEKDQEVNPYKCDIVDSEVTCYYSYDIFTFKLDTKKEVNGEVEIENGKVISIHGNYDQVVGDERYLVIDDVPFVKYKGSKIFMLPALTNEYIVEQGNEYVKTVEKIIEEEYENFTKKPDCIRLGGNSIYFGLENGEYFESESYTVEMEGILPNSDGEIILNPETGKIESISFSISGKPLELTEDGNVRLKQYSITYKNVMDTTGLPKYVEFGDKLEIDLTNKVLSDSKITVNLNKKRMNKTNYTFKDSKLIIPNVTGNITVIGASKFEVDSWATIIDNVQKGKTDAYNLGDEKEITLTGENAGTYTVRIANKSSNDTVCTDTTEKYSQTACGFVIEFADIITRQIMNSTYGDDWGYASGGWPGSELYTYVTNNIYNSLPEEVRDNIIYTRVVDRSGLATMDKLYILSVKEITGEYDHLPTRQLDYYKENYIIIYDDEYYNSTNGYYYGCALSAVKNYNGIASTWWLRDWAGTDGGTFNYIGSSGIHESPGWPYDKYGVAPAFRLR